MKQQIPEANRELPLGSTLIFEVWKEYCAQFGNCAQCTEKLCRDAELHLLDIFNKGDNNGN